MDARSRCFRRIGRDPQKGDERGRSAETLGIPHNSWTGRPAVKARHVSCARSNRRHHDFRRSRGVPGSSLAPRGTCPSVRDPAPSHRSMPRQCRRPGDEQPQPLRPAPKDALRTTRISPATSARHTRFRLVNAEAVRIPSPHLRVVPSGRELRTGGDARIPGRSSQKVRRGPASTTAQIRPKR
jgi:hypothetical protein